MLTQLWDQGFPDFFFFFKKKNESSLEYKLTLISIWHLKIWGKMAQTHHIFTLSFHNKALPVSHKLSPCNYFPKGMLITKKKNKIETEASKFNRWLVFSSFLLPQMFPVILGKPNVVPLLVTGLGVAGAQKEACPFGTWFWTSFRGQEKYSFVAAKVQEWILAVVPNSLKQSPHYQHLIGRLSLQLPPGPR